MDTVKYLVRLLIHSLTHEPLTWSYGTFYAPAMANRRDPGSVRWQQTPSERIYPWHDWFDGSAWELTCADFDGSLAAFRARCYRMAREFEYRLRTRAEGDRLFIQALASDGSPLGPVPD